MATGVDSVSNRNEYQEYFLGGKGGRCLGLTNFPPSCTDCLEIWEPQPPGTFRASPGCKEIALSLPLTLKLFSCLQLRNITRRGWVVSYRRFVREGWDR